ncbi:exported hypothetical protein [uncultured Stenotrophomonas sp.]|uniref:Uncharacterized protein n=1 Tax=uncultured Stenotrophomonas sp. TaxID=165438 RepID=A0A1Y5PZX9_9GAMM|nr:exported hypothetical protein [uncultured Stenotrophomonas sp.]
MIEPLISLLMLLAGASPVQTGATQISDPVAACHAWIEDRAWSDQEDDPQTLVLSPVAACFDGAIASGSLEALHAWIDAVPASAQPVLVVRSRGGDSETALALAEKLQARDTGVHVVEVCASACANYFYAGVRDRHIQPASLLLFHGGFSANNRARGLAMLEAYLSGPQGATVPDPEANRRAVGQTLDALQARQDALYRRIGVDPRIVHGFDALDVDTLDDAHCGGPSPAPRHFLYFDDAQMARLGIAPASGHTEQDPLRVNAAIAALDADFIACRAPETSFAGTGAREADSAR